jgi:pimeloyl-ACP methyl ester carboxylesterase
MIEGTGSAARDLYYFDTAIASLGYSVISLDYPNNVITTTCSDSHDSSCFNAFRQEIVFGTPVSPIVQVDSVNSLYNRLLAWLRYLVQHDPGHGWEEYLHDDAIQWDKIMVGGHSQGAGHAAYFGKKFRLDRVLIFSGPQDYLGYFHTPAGWLSDSSATERSRYYAFLHVRDPYDFSKQWMNCETLMQIRRTDSGLVNGPDTLMVSPGLAPARTSRHIFVTDIQSNNPHGSTLGREFRQVLEYMLEGEEPAMTKATAGER